MAWMQKHARGKLISLVGQARPLQVEEIRRNLVTWFSVYSYDYDRVSRLPPVPDTPPDIYPGMIFTVRGEPVCVIDHWGSFNDIRSSISPH